MAKTNAEKQWEYRELKKLQLWKKNLKKESKRKMLPRKCFKEFRKDEVTITFTKKSPNLKWTRNLLRKENQKKTNSDLNEKGKI